MYVYYVYTCIYSTCKCLYVCMHEYNVPSADINECTSGSDLCSQVCINSDGGYKCSCNDGYKLQDDEVTCVGNDQH